MSRKECTQTSEYQWEQALLNDYDDYRWRQVLDPLYHKSQQWQAGELDHMDMDKAIHQTYKEPQEAYVFFIQNRDWSVRLIQLDEAWQQSDYVERLPGCP